VPVLSERVCADKPVLRPGFEESSGFTLFYVFRLSGSTDVFAFMRHVKMETTSIATIFPSACWYEREIRTVWYRIYGCF